MATRLETQLRQFYATLDRGPRRISPLSAAQQYCRWLARSHYENFTVASWLLPRHLLPHFYSIYAYCRWADDLADETGDWQQSLALLDWWEEQLEECYQGNVEHPVFMALLETIEEFDIPIEPFANLLVAFRQDQLEPHYATLADLLGYCRNSANPVGRLVLYLGRSDTLACGCLSDSVCTGLQLANFAQDVANDWDRGRIYLTQEDMQAAGYTQEMYARGQFNDEFRALMTQQCDRAEEYLEAGLPLVDRVPAELRLEVALFIGGGLKILSAIRRIDYNVWRRRPIVTKREKLTLLARCWWWTRRNGQGWWK